MKLISKKRMSLLLSLIMIITSLPLAGIAAFAENSTKYDYEVLDDGTAIISFYYGNEETVEIPSEIDGHKVVALYNDAFYTYKVGEEATEGDATQGDATQGDATTGDAGTDGDYYDRDGIKKIIIPETIEYVDPYNTFWDLHNLEAIEVAEGNRFYSSQDGVLFDKDKTVLLKFPIGKAGEYEIPNTVKVINDYAFYSCSKITGVTIPDSVLAINQEAFFDCDGLTSVKIPVGTEILSYEVFADCSNLTDIYILNRKCNISIFAIPEEATVHGFKGSSAEGYAKAFKNNFEEIKATISDAKKILQSVAGLITLTEAEAKAADLDNDGEVTIVDAKWVLQIVVKLRDPGTLELINKK